MKETIDEIVAASEEPMSIIIVGVGQANFDSMEELDADISPLYSEKYKKYMSRDIVQFVKFEDFQHDQLKLAKETLEEIPKQLTDYYNRWLITPLPTNYAERMALLTSTRDRRLR